MSNGMDPNIGRAHILTSMCGPAIPSGLAVLCVLLAVLLIRLKWEVDRRGGIINALCPRPLLHRRYTGRAYVPRQEQQHQDGDDGAVVPVDRSEDETNVEAGRLAREEEQRELRRVQQEEEQANSAPRWTPISTTKFLDLAKFTCGYFCCITVAFIYGVIETSMEAGEWSKFWFDNSSSEGYGMPGGRFLFTMELLRLMVLLLLPPLIAGPFVKKVIVRRFVRGRLADGRGQGKTFYEAMRAFGRYSPLLRMNLRNPDSLDYRYDSVFDHEEYVSAASQRSLQRESLTAAAPHSVVAFGSGAVARSWDEDTPKASSDPYQTSDANHKSTLQGGGVGVAGSATSRRRWGGTQYVSDSESDDEFGGGNGVDSRECTDDELDDAENEDRRELLPQQPERLRKGAKAAKRAQWWAASRQRQAAASSGSIANHLSRTTSQGSTASSTRAPSSEVKMGGKTYVSYGEQVDWWGVQTLVWCLVLLTASTAVSLFLLLCRLVLQVVYPFTWLSALATEIAVPLRCGSKMSEVANVDDFHNTSFKVAFEVCVIVVTVLIVNSVQVRLLTFRHRKLRFHKAISSPNRHQDGDDRVNAFEASQYA